MTALLVLICSPALAQEPQEKPSDIGQTEEVEVRLVLIETLVLDREGRSVADLTQDDFQLAVEGIVTEIESLDVFCPAGAVGDPGEIGTDQQRQQPTAPEAQRRIVFVVDYYHLVRQDRTKVLDQMREMVRQAKAPNEEVMIVAVANGLRIEQRFTKDSAEILEAIHRLDYDVTLFASDHSAATGESYFEALSTLMDVLEAYDGPKAVVLFSALLSRSDVREAWFADVIERAAAARTAIYPAYARWMKFPPPRMGTHRKRGTAGGQRVLPTLSVGTGGRVPPSTTDLSISYARAQRDLGCRYAIGFRLQADEALEPHQVGVAVLRPGSQVFHPTRVRLWSEEERRVSRLRAAFIDPERFDHPLVRAIAFPVRPVTGKTWATLLALQFPLPEEIGGSDFDLRATLTESDTGKAYSFQRRFPISAREGVSGDRPVTVLRDSTLKAGAHTLTVALSQPGREDVVTGRMGFEVPEVPRDATFLRGPLLARVVREGVLLEAFRNETAESRPLNRILGDEETVEILLVHEIESSDSLVCFWEVCSTSKKPPSASTVVERRFLGSDGQTIHSLDPVPFDPRGDGRARCRGRLDQLPAGSLQPGEYRLEIVVRDSGKEIAQQSVPILVH
jgi:VWFA-related protein